MHRSLLHMGEELLHGILHFDGKALRTLPMLVAYPGQLTRRYIDGQRTRFVSPLALFLFMIFLMFFTASYTTNNNLAVAPAEFRSALIKLEKRSADAKNEVTQAEARLKAASASGRDTTALAEEVVRARERLTEAQEALASLSMVNLRGVEDGQDKPQGHSSTLSITTGIEPLDAAFKVALKNPELTLYKLKNTASKFSFLLVPISLPFLWLMFFWKRGVTMYDHAVFSLYSLSFMSLMFVGIMLLSLVGLDVVVAPLLLLAPPIHMFFQLKGTYGLSLGSALWRTLALLFASAVVFVLYLLFILTLTVQ